MGDIPQIDEILDTLQKHIWVGRTYLRMWRQVNNKLAEHNDLLKIASAFFSFTIRSFIDSALLHLARLVDSSSEAVTVRYLLNVAERHAASFPHASKDHVLAGVADDRARLEQLVGTIAAVVTRRDKQLAHTDKENITKPEAIKTESAISFRDVDDLFVALSDVVNRYSGFWRDSATVPELLEWDDFEELADVALRGLALRDAERAEMLRRAEQQLAELEGGDKDGIAS